MNDVLDMFSVVSTRRTQFGRSGLVRRGNTSGNHRSATKNEVVDVNNQLRSTLVENGGYFWLQHKGVAEMNKDNTQPMVFPASGTVMGRGALYKVNKVKKQINDRPTCSLCTRYFI